MSTADRPIRDWRETSSRCSRISNPAYAVALVSVIVVAWKCLSRYLAAESTWPDEALYMWAGRRILQEPSTVLTKEIIAFHPPLFPVMIALSVLFFPVTYAARLVPLAFSLEAIPKPVSR